MFNNLPTLQDVFIALPGVLMALTFHEFAHAWVATRFGDDTPRLQGRLTLNPIAHLDIIGTLLLLIGGFGWAKPVQTNPSRLRPRVWGDIAVSLAGVTMNFILAVLFLILGVLGHRYLSPSPYTTVLVKVLLEAFQLNVILVGFNLLPLPPLDGFHVIRYLFPRGSEQLVATLYRWGPMILILLFFTNVADPLLNGIYDAIFAAIRLIVSPVLGAI
ncbi:MAG: site-2 protease family protein [Mycobacterium leprae]